MNLLQPFKAIKQDFISKNNIAIIENDLTAWLLVKYNEFKYQQTIVKISIAEVNYYLKYHLYLPISKDYNKVICAALRKLTEMHNFEKSLLDGEVICFKRRAQI